MRHSYRRVARNERLLRVGLRWFHRVTAKGRNRRASPVAANSGDRLLSKPKAGTQPWRREPRFMPLSRHSRRRPGPAKFGGKPSFPICPAAMCACFQSGRSLPDARTPDAAAISALQLVGRKAEGYHRRRGVGASLSRGPPHGRSGVATGSGP